MFRGGTRKQTDIQHRYVAVFNRSTWWLYKYAECAGSTEQYISTSTKDTCHGTRTPPLLVLVPGLLNDTTTTPPPRHHLPATTFFEADTMSKVSSTTTSSTDFQSIFNTALEAYEKKTKKDLLTHPLSAKLQDCDLPAAILSVLQELVQQFDQRRCRNERLESCLNPIVNVLYAFSTTIGEGVGLVGPKLQFPYDPSSESSDYVSSWQGFPPAKAIFAGIGILLLVG